MYQSCSNQLSDRQSIRRDCTPNKQDEIEIEKTNYVIKDSINSSINNKGFLVQIGALIIFDDVFDSATALANVDGSPFEFKLDENGNITINGTKIDIESTNNKNKTIVIKNSKVSTDIK